MKDGAEALKSGKKHRVCQFATGGGHPNSTRASNIKKENGEENASDEGKTPQNGDFSAKKFANVANEKDNDFQEEVKEKSLLKLPSFPPHQWPGFLQQMVGCAPTEKQRDALRLAAFTAIGFSFNWIFHTG